MRLRIGIYWVFIEDWLSVFRREQLLIIRTEKYAQDIYATMLNIFQFLDLPPLSDTDMARVIRAHHRNVARRGNGPILNTTKALLDNFYKSHNRRLEYTLSTMLFL